MHSPAVNLQLDLSALTLYFPPASHLRPFVLVSCTSILSLLTRVFVSVLRGGPRRSGPSFSSILSLFARVFVSVLRGGPRRSRQSPERRLEAERGPGNNHRLHLLLLLQVNDAFSLYIGVLILGWELTVSCLCLIVLVQNLTLLRIFSVNGLR